MIAGCALKKLWHLPSSILDLRSQKAEYLSWLPVTGVGALVTLNKESATSSPHPFLQFSQCAAVQFLLADLSCGCLQH